MWASRTRQREDGVEHHPEGSGVDEGAECLQTGAVRLDQHADRGDSVLTAQARGRLRVEWRERDEGSAVAQGGEGPQGGRPSDRVEDGVEGGRDVC